MEREELLVTTDDVAGWCGWAGDVCPESKTWITDARLALRIDALDTRTLAQLRNQLSCRRFGVDIVDKLYVTALEPVTGYDEDADPFGTSDLISRGGVRRFSAAYLLRLACALPDSDLFIGQIDTGVAKRTCLAACHDGRLVGVLMSIVTVDEFVKTQDKEAT